MTELRYSREKKKKQFKFINHWFIENLLHSLFGHSCFCTPPYLFASLYQISWFSFIFQWTSIQHKKPDAWECKHCTSQFFVSLNMYLEMWLNFQHVTELLKTRFYGQMAFSFSQDEIHPTQLQSSHPLCFWPNKSAGLLILGKGKQVVPASFQKERDVRKLDLPALQNLFLETFLCTCRWITIQLDFQALAKPDRDFPRPDGIRWIRIGKF